VAVDSITLINMFKKDCISRGFAPGTLREYPRAIKDLSNFVKGDLLSIDEDKLIEYIDYLRNDRKVGQKTIKCYFSSISTFCDFLVFKGMKDHNPVRTISKRYLYSYKTQLPSHRKRIISVEEAARLVNSILNTRDRAMVTVLFKTGMRCHELAELNVSDVNMESRTISIHPTAKRTNNLVYFDQETFIVLSRWLEYRNKLGLETPALFTSLQKGRMHQNGICRMVEKYASKVGLHDPESDKPEERFSPHCCRHWFTTHLRKAGMPREYLQELRGDVIKESVDIYIHIDHNDLRISYLNCIPKLGIGF
jgi:integrase/recombinase XerD